MTKRKWNKEFWMGLAVAIAVAPIAARSQVVECINCAGTTVDPYQRQFGEDIAWLNSLEHTLADYKVPVETYTDWKRDPSPLDPELVKELWNIAPIRPTEAQLANQKTTPFTNPLDCPADWTGPCYTAENLFLNSPTLPRAFAATPVWKSDRTIPAGYGIPVHQPGALF